MANDIVTVELKATKILQLDSKRDWMLDIPDLLPSKSSADNFLFVDKNGNLLTIGLDFRVAEERNTYPVTVYLAQRTSAAADGPEAKYLIWTGNYVGNSLLFWREGHAGYTTDISKAHRFTFEEAQKVIRAAKTHNIISLDYLTSIATLQVNADHLNREQVGKEVPNA